MNQHYDEVRKIILKGMQIMHVHVPVLDAETNLGVTPMVTVPHGVTITPDTVNQLEAYFRECLRAEFVQEIRSDFDYREEVRQNIDKLYPKTTARVVVPYHLYRVASGPWKGIIGYATSRDSARLTLRTLSLGGYNGDDHPVGTSFIVPTDYCEKYLLDKK